MRQEIRERFRRSMGPVLGMRFVEYLKALEKDCVVEQVEIERPTVER